MPCALGNALQQHRHIAARLRGRQMVVFLDYDGTLSPIAERPDLAVMAGAMRAAVARLAHACTTVIISGRSCRDVRALVDLNDLHYAGNHGLEIEGPSGAPLHCWTGEAFREDVGRFACQAQIDLRGIPGVLVEDKGLSLSVHYRQVAPADVAAVETAVDRLLPHFPSLHKRHGKKVVEIRPAVDWDKGKAVLWLLARLGARNGMAIYVGDDVTDEDAFAAIRDCGIGIRVGAPTAVTAAHYCLADTDEVRRFLAGLAVAWEPA